MQPPQSNARYETTAGAALLLGGAMWGLYWIPVRAFLDLGLTGSWPGLVIYTATLLAVLPWVWRARHGIIGRWRGLILSGMFTGAAFGLYSTSLVYTDVVRAILLFYLTPIWGTLLGLAVLGERLQPARVVGLFCGIGGLVAVLGGEQSLPWPRNAGDWLALASGIAWAFGSLGLYRTKGVPVVGQIFVFLIGALAVAGFGILIEIDLGYPNPSQIMAADLAFYAALSAIFVLPMLYLTIWPATLLSPARVGLLLMSEVVVGLVSAALLANEPFGWREGLGAAMIVSAAVLELVPKHAKS
ncbi:MAG: DMT family transporter [Paracoccaceae bacterium]